MENITFGNTWNEKYITGSHNSNKITKVKKTDYGYRVNLFNNYVTIYSVKLIVNKDGSAKAHVKMDKNYQPTERFTYYFAPDGREIKDRNNNTYKERAEYNRLRSN